MTYVRYEDCELSRWSGRADRCRWCDGPLPKGRRVWCSGGSTAEWEADLRNGTHTYREGCAGAWDANHVWNVARAAAIRAAGGRCVTCVAVGIPLTARPEWIEATWGGPIAFSYGLQFRRRDEVGPAAVPLFARGAWRVVPDRWGQPGDLAIEYWQEGRWRRRIGEPLEVNHVTPREGRGYGYGCAHHQDGLEVLCRFHHVIVTTNQGRARRGLPPLEPAPLQDALL